MQFPIISNIIGKLVKCRLDKGKMGCISNKVPSPKLVTRADSGGRYWDQCCLIFALITWVVGRASLQVVQTWEEWVIELRDVLPSMGVWPSWRGGQRNLVNIRQSSASRLREGILPLCLSLVGHPWSAGSSLGHQRHKRMWRYWTEPAKGHKDAPGTGKSLI